MILIEQAEQDENIDEPESGLRTSFVNNGMIAVLPEKPHSFFIGVRDVFIEEDDRYDGKLTIALIITTRHVESGEMFTKQLRTSFNKERNVFDCDWRTF